MYDKSCKKHKLKPKGLMRFISFGGDIFLFGRLKPPSPPSPYAWLRPCEWVTEEASRENDERVKDSQLAKIIFPELLIF